MPPTKTTAGTAMIVPARRSSDRTNTTPAAATAASHCTDAGKASCGTAAVAIRTANAANTLVLKRNARLVRAGMVCGAGPRLLDVIVICFRRAVFGTIVCGYQLSE